MGKTKVEQLASGVPRTCAGCGFHVLYGVVRGALITKVTPE